MHTYTYIFSSSFLSMYFLIFRYVFYVCNVLILCKPGNAVTEKGGDTC